MLSLEARKLLYKTIETTEQAQYDEDSNLPVKRLFVVDRNTNTAYRIIVNLETNDAFMSFELDSADTENESSGILLTCFIKNNTTEIPNYKIFKKQYVENGTIIADIFYLYRNGKFVNFESDGDNIQLKMNLELQYGAISDFKIVDMDSVPDDVIEILDIDFSNRSANPAWIPSLNESENNVEYSILGSNNANGSAEVHRSKGLRFKEEYNSQNSSTRSSLVFNGNDSNSMIVFDSESNSIIFKFDSNPEA